MGGRSHTFSSHSCKFSLAVVLSLSATAPVAQVLEYKKPTEQLVKRYEKLVADGFLLTPEGWARASKLVEHPIPYPPDSEIQLISAPGIIGETRLTDDHALVETKWGDYYGTIDSRLRYRAVEPSGSIMVVESFSLVFVHRRPESGGASAASDSAEWKIEGPSVRAASIPAAIKYVQEARDKSNDPDVRSNADRTIAALKLLTSGCGNASAC
jgi:hypothetical protein